MRTLTGYEMAAVNGAADLTNGEYATVAAVTGQMLIPAVLVAALNNYAPNVLQNGVLSVVTAPLATGLGVYTGFRLYHYLADA